MEFWVMTLCVVEMFPCQSSLRQQHNVYGVMYQNIVICFYLSQGQMVISCGQGKEHSGQMVMSCGQGKEHSGQMVMSCGQGKEHSGPIKDETFMVSKATVGFQLQINPVSNIKYHYLLINYELGLCFAVTVPTPGNQYTCIKFT